MSLAAKRVGLFVVSLLVFLGLGEAVLRLLLPDRYYVWPPNFEHTFRPDPEIIHGVEGPSHLTINSIGVRGDPPSDDFGYRILALGGSTTICVYLDDSEAWPHRVQERVNQARGPHALWVGNAGRPGHSSAQHALQAEKLLAQHPEIDAVLVLLGINDLLINLSWILDPAAAPTGMPEEDAELHVAFAVFPGWRLRNAVGRLWRSGAWHPVDWMPDVPVVDDTGSLYEILRRRRKEASSFLESPPDLSVALAVYTSNVNAIVDAAQASGVRLVFLTQPTLWRPGLSSVEQELLWGGGPPIDRVKPGATYYSVGVLAEAMETYNRALLEICGERDLERFDLAAQMPSNARLFYDDAHFTEAGAARVAELVSGYLLQREPFAIERER